MNGLNSHHVWAKLLFIIKCCLCDAKTTTNTFNWKNFWVSTTYELTATAKHSELPFRGAEMNRINDLGLAVQNEWVHSAYWAPLLRGAAPMNYILGSRCNTHLHSSFLGLRYTHSHIDTVMPECILQLSCSQHGCGIPEYPTSCEAFLRSSENTRAVSLSWTQAAVLKELLLSQALQF